MQRRDAQIGEQDRRGEPEPAAAPLAEQHAAEQRRPQDVADRRQDAAQDLGLHQVAQREPVGGEYGVEGVSGALEGGEAGADGGAQYQAVPQAAHPQSPADQDQGGQLGRLLDQADAQVRPGRGREQAGLQDGGAEYADEAADAEAAEDPVGAEAGGVAFVRPGRHGDRDEEAAEQDDRRHQVAVPGEEGDGDGRDPQQQSAEEDPGPLGGAGRGAYGRGGEVGGVAVSGHR